MDKNKIIELATTFIAKSEDNYIKRENAINENLIGLKIFEDPILGFGSSNDEYFKLLKSTNAIGSHFMLPGEWLSNSNTVISFFLHFTESVRKSNSLEKNWPSSEWLHGRIEGQALINKLNVYLSNELIDAGYDSIIPSQDKRAWNIEKSSDSELSFTSNWSERHVAYVCGLGTFGLSKGLITKNGVSGRFCSIITSLEIESSPREYNDIYAYCSNCGDCIKQCPVNAISFENGKNHEICSAFLNLTKSKFIPRYGCGKCQVNVACESCIPQK